MDDITTKDIRGIYIDDLAEQMTAPKLTAFSNEGEDSGLLYYKKSSKIRASFKDNFRFCAEQNAIMVEPGEGQMPGIQRVLIDELKLDGDKHLHLHTKYDQKAKTHLYVSGKQIPKLVVAHVQARTQSNATNIQIAQWESDFDDTARREKCLTINLNTMEREWRNCDQPAFGVCQLTLNGIQAAATKKLGQVMSNFGGLVRYKEATRKMSKKFESMTKGLEPCESRVPLSDQLELLRPLQNLNSGEIGVNLMFVLAPLLAQDLKALENLDQLGRLPMLQTEESSTSWDEFKGNQPLTPEAIQIQLDRLEEKITDQRIEPDATNQVLGEIVLGKMDKYITSAPLCQTEASQGENTTFCRIATPANENPFLQKEEASRQFLSKNKLNAGVEKYLKNRGLPTSKSELQNKIEQAEQEKIKPLQVEDVEEEVNRLLTRSPMSLLRKQLGLETKHVVTSILAEDPGLFITFAKLDTAMADLLKENSLSKVTNAVESRIATMVEQKWQEEKIKTASSIPEDFSWEKVDERVKWVLNKMPGKTTEDALELSRSEEDAGTPGQDAVPTITEGPNGSQHTQVISWQQINNRIDEKMVENVVTKDFLSTKLLQYSNNSQIDEKMEENMVTKEFLSTKLLQYSTNSQVNDKMVENVVTKEFLSTKLLPYSTISQVDERMGENVVTKDFLVTELFRYSTTSQVNWKINDVVSRLPKHGKPDLSHLVEKSKLKGSIIKVLSEQAPLEEEKGQEEIDEAVKRWMQTQTKEEGNMLWENDDFKANMNELVSTSFDSLIEKHILEANDTTKWIKHKINGIVRKQKGIISKTTVLEDFMENAGVFAPEYMNQNETDQDNILSFWWESEGRNKTKKMIINVLDKLHTPIARGDIIFLACTMTATACAVITLYCNWWRQLNRQGTNSESSSRDDGASTPRRGASPEQRSASNSEDFNESTSFASNLGPDAELLRLAINRASLRMNTAIDETRDPAEEETFPLAYRHTRSPQASTSDVNLDPRVSFSHTERYDVDEIIYPKGYFAGKTPRSERSVDSDSEEETAERAEVLEEPEKPEERKIGWTGGPSCRGCYPALESGSQKKDVRGDGGNDSSGSEEPEDQPLISNYFKNQIRGDCQSVSCDSGTQMEGSASCTSIETFESESSIPKNRCMECYSENFQVPISRESL